MAMAAAGAFGDEQMQAISRIVNEQLNGPGGITQQIAALNANVAALLTGAKEEIAEVKKVIAEHNAKLAAANAESKTTEANILLVAESAQGRFDLSQAEATALTEKMGTLRVDVDNFANNYLEKIKQTEHAYAALAGQVNGAVEGVRAEAKVAYDTNRQQMLDEGKAAYEANRNELSDWAKGFELRIAANIQQSPGSAGNGRRSDDADDRKPSHPDKKELAVWKLPDNVDKMGFRHWVDAIAIHLEMIHGWKHADYVLNRIKRCQLEITPSTLEECLAEANVDLEKVVGFEEVDYSGTQGTYNRDYVFADKTKFMHAFRVGKLNTYLYDRTAGIENKNGLEIFRQVCQIVDAVPENAPFFMNSDLLNLVKLHGPKVVDLKSLYGFTILLKRKNAEYKKIVGKDPEDEQSKMILWNVLDPASR